MDDLNRSRIDASSNERQNAPPMVPQASSQGTKRRRMSTSAPLADHQHMMSELTGMLGDMLQQQQQTALQFQAAMHQQLETVIKRQEAAQLQQTNNIVGLSADIRTIMQRVDILEQQPRQSGTGASAAASSSIAGATSWNGPPTSQAPGDNQLAQKPFELPMFSGDPAQWPIFISAYRQSTTAFRYSALQNVFRLQRCLQGEARLAVAGLLMSEDNLEELLETLELRFGRPELLADDQINKIREFPLISERHFEQLIVYSSQVSTVVAYLNTDATRHELHNSTLLKELVLKLPQQRRYEWLQHIETLEGRPTAIDFSRWLKTVAVRVSKMPTLPATNTQRQPAGGRPREERRVMLNVGESCEVCHRSHCTSECENFRRQTTRERWTTARRLHMCFGCLRLGHSYGQCNNKSSRGYHRLLCDENDTRATPTQSGDRNGESRTPEHDATTAADDVEARPANTNPFNNPPAAQVLTCLDEPELPLLFRVVPVVLRGPDRSVNTFALLDDGSSVTLIDADMAEELKLDGPSRQIDLKWIGSHSTSEQSKSVALSICGTEPYSKQHDLKDVRTVKQLSLPTQSVALISNDPRHDHLRDLPIATYQHATPKILIGLDNCHLGAASKTRIGRRGGPIATKTRLGWVVHGRQTYGTGEHVLHCHEPDNRYAAIEVMMRDFQSTESFGVMAPRVTMESDEDTRARKLLESTTIRINGRFQTGLLWRYDDVHLPDSYPMALRRYGMVVRKMKKNAEYATLYTRQMADLVSKGYARKLSMSEASARDGRTWFLPHFGVQSIYKPGKLRIVFDAAAEVSGTSLNSVLLKGPDLNQQLLAILMKFRMRRVGVCADIAEMFLQIGIRPEDRRAQRFLWREDGGSPPDIYQMEVMTFGAACSPTSAQYAKNLNALDFMAEFPEAVEAIRTLHYVDDLVASFATDEEAVHITRGIVEVHRRGGFMLRNFVSNSAYVLSELGETPAGVNAVDMQLDAGACSKILGLRWRTKTDTFVFALNFEKLDPDIFNGARTPTKREVLSAVMSVFDPFGFLADVMLPTKILIQELWRIGAGWDEPVPAKIEARWRLWCGVLGDMGRFSIPRCYSPVLAATTEVQLHCFADASEEAFAAALYWRIRHGAEYTVAFVAGKTRCAPLKQLSVPRLELQAAVLATRLYKMVCENHNISIAETIFWTDSRTVIQWLNSTERRFRPFVAHRVSEVLDSTIATWWRWLPTKENVADDATRCQTSNRYNPDGRWTRGPEFLRLEEDKWPQKRSFKSDNGAQLEEEIRHRFVGVVCTGEFIEFDRFSSFHRLSRTVGWLLRFVHNVRARGRGIERAKGELRIGELQAATEILCRLAQAEGFAQEYSALLDGEIVSKRSSIAVLMPYLDERKVMRLYGRTDSADPEHLPLSAQRPILLPNRHHLTTLIVSSHHAKMAHQLEGSTICSIRRMFWVPHLRTLVRRVRRKCRACKIRFAQPNPPVTGQLPADRMTPYVPPFSYTGVDYFGPIQVTVGRRREKRWICLFTCLTVRAVHMEIAENLSTDACLVCVRNFCNLRGIPVRLRSDCGTNFIGADHELKKMGDIFDRDDVHQEMGVRGIEWKFNCPSNPEAGGAWERLIQSTKRVLTVTMKEIAPRVETLRSFVIEAANLINSRPLTHIPVSPEDCSPLTPNHFLLGHMNTTTATDDFVPRQLCDRKQWRVLTQLKNHFWKRWVSEYLPELTRRRKQIDEVPLKEGDLVLICDANQTRGTWLRGRIIRVVCGVDGRVRTAEVRTKDGVLRRPVTKLAVLDVEE